MLEAWCCLCLGNPAESLFRFRDNPQVWTCRCRGNRRALQCLCRESPGGALSWLCWTD